MKEYDEKLPLLSVKTQLFLAFVSGAQAGAEFARNIDIAVFGQCDAEDGPHEHDEEHL
jgi:hypothetical protein